MTDSNDNIEQQTAEQEVVEKPENSFMDGREGEAAALAASLGQIDQEHDFVPKPEQAPQTSGEQDTHQVNAATMSPDMAQGLAFAAIESYESIIKTMVGQDFALTENMKKEAVMKYGPLIVKYGPTAIGTFGQYKDEIMAGLFTVALVKESFTQVRAIKAIAANQPVKPTETKQDEVQEDAA
ncbi:hypothetical protein L3V43_20645 [Pseudoalteromonas sp. L23]|uniref:hypothetical protein n=1 Tax=unclassified Pseudoalteromonas TaxID=194690 RepID=UPI001EF07397|nr:MULTISPECIES: hypothetical protein [unclassified Pseudoalteromonas]MCF7515966.1 hypothetical protein [Pseudoalteromonas sp. L7]MCF7528062.1 hypothetical protein [Pseudoalteromonas sp. L23]